MNTNVRILGKRWNGEIIAFRKNKTGRFLKNHYFNTET